MAEKINLVYFDGRGKAEIIRQTLVYLGLEFTETYLKEKREMEKLREDGDLLFQQVPLLIVGNRKIVQSGAIMRYLARRGGLYGKNNEEATRIDELFEGTRDFVGPMLGMTFRPDEEVLAQMKEKLIPRYFASFTKVLKETGTGFTVGSSLTLADFGLLEPLLVVEDYFGQEVFRGFPELNKFFKDMTSDPKISAFLNGPHRKPKNNQTYVDIVKRVLY